MCKLCALGSDAQAVSGTTSQCAPCVHRRTVHPYTPAIGCQVKHSSHTAYRMLMFMSEQGGISMRSTGMCLGLSSMPDGLCPPYLYYSTCAVHRASCDCAYCEFKFYVRDRANWRPRAEHGQVLAPYMYAPGSGISTSWLHVRGRITTLVNFRRRSCSLAARRS